MNYQPTTQKRFSETVPLEECFTESPTAAAWALFFGIDLHTRILVGIIVVPLFYAKSTHDAHVKLLYVRVVAHPNTATAPPHSFYRRQFQSQPPWS